MLVFNKNVEKCLATHAERVRVCLYGSCRGNVEDRERERTRAKIYISIYIFIQLMHWKWVSCRRR